MLVLTTKEMVFHRGQNSYSETLFCKQKQVLKNEYHKISRAGGKKKTIYGVGARPLKI